MPRTTRWVWIGAALAVALSGCSAGAGGQDEPGAAASSEATAEVTADTAASDDTPTGSGQSPEDAAYEPTPIGQITAGTPEGWDERTIGELVLATPQGWEQDPNYGAGMTRSAGWVAHDAPWTLHGPNPAKITATHSPQEDGLADRLVEWGGTVHQTDDHVTVVSHNPLDDLVLGRHVHGSAAVLLADRTDQYTIEFTLPPDDVSVELLAAVVGSVRAAG